jgi:peptidyl-prolyl cis-trans isomerase B (cyclophilin B)
VAGKGKQTSAERRKEREAAARAAAAKRARKTRVQATAAVLVLALVGAGVAFEVKELKGGGSSTNAANKPNEILSPAPSPNTAGAPAGKANCLYVPQPPPPSKSPAQVDPRHPTFPPAVAEASAPEYETLDTTEGTIVLELDAKAAPCAVNSFVSLANQGFYNNTVCHRLVESTEQNLNFHTLQCGDPTGTGIGGPGYKFANENTDGARYPRGVVALANSGPNINGSQFFMMYKDSDFEADYTPFAHILQGIPVLQKIADGGTEQNPATQQNDSPKTKVTITKVTISQTKPAITPDPASAPTPTPSAGAKSSKKTSSPTPTETPSGSPTP